MLRWAEIAGAVALALLLHGLLLIGGAAPEGGAAATGGAAGAGGVVAIADPEIAELVKEWTKPPTPQPAAPTPKLAAAPDLPGSPSVEIDRTPPPPEPKKRPEAKPKKVERKKPKKQSSAGAAGPRGAGGRTTSKRDSSGSGAAASSGSGRSSTSLVRAWGGRIRADIARQRAYPAASRRRREQGRVVLRLTVSRSGALISASIARSSGSSSLDKAALTAARRAAPYPSAPSGLTAASYRFSIPVSFKFR